jgi:hypothetical protein
MAELNQPIQITERGKTKRVTKLEAVFKKLTADSLRGDAKATSLVLGLYAKAAAEAGASAQDDGTLAASEQQMIDAYLERQVEDRLAARQAAPNAGDQEQDQPKTEERGE